MTFVELHFAGEDGHDAIERFEIEQFTFEAVQELLEEHWGHIEVSSWSVADNTETEEDCIDVLRIEVVGKYVGVHLKYFEEAFEEQFKSKMQNLDLDFDYDKHQADIADTSEVYIVSSQGKKYCVLTTSDLIVSEGCIFASPKASKALQRLFGDIRDEGHSIDRDDVKVITEPKRIAGVVKKIERLEVQQGVSEELRFQLAKLKWDLKQALFQDYHDEMISALVSEPVPASQDPPVNQDGILRRIWKAVYEERLLHDLADTLWATFQTAVWMAIPLMMFNCTPKLLVLSVVNDKVLNLLNRVQTMTGLRVLNPVISILQTTRAWWLLLTTGTKVFVVAFAIDSHRRRRSNPQQQDDVSMLRKIARCGLCLLQDLTLFFVTLFPPLCMEYQSQLDQLEHSHAD